MYYVSILKIQNGPSSNIYFENLFNVSDIDRTAIHMLQRLVKRNTCMQSFQYNVIINVLFLNKIICQSNFTNRALVIFKLYVHKSREKKFININNFIAPVRKVKKKKRKCFK